MDSESLSLLRVDSKSPSLLAVENSPIPAEISFPAVRRVVRPESSIARGPTTRHRDPQSSIRTEGIKRPGRFSRA